MSDIIDNHIEIAMVQEAQIYGLGEKGFCGDIHRPVACDRNATTASGQRLDPDAITGAVPLGKSFIMRPKTICVLDYRGREINININDKKNPRFINRKGLDLTPAAVRAITGKPVTKYWSGKLQACGRATTITETYTFEEIEVRHYVIQ